MSSSMDDESSDDDGDEAWITLLQNKMFEEDEKKKLIKSLHTKVFYGLHGATNIIISFVPHIMLSSLRKVSYHFLSFSDTELRKRAISQLEKRGLGMFGIEKALYDWATGNKVKTPKNKNKEVNNKTTETRSSRSLGLSGRIGQMYKTKFRHIIYNISDPKNDLKEQVLKKNISSEMLVKMKMEEMASKKIKNERTKAKKDSMKGRLITTKQRHLTMGHFSDRFRCPKCNSQQCTFRNRPSSYNSKGSNQIIVHCCL